MSDEKRRIVCYDEELPPLLPKDPDRPDDDDPDRPYEVDDDERTPVVFPAALTLRETRPNPVGFCLPTPVLLPPTLRDEKIVGLRTGV